MSHPSFPLGGPGRSGGPPTPPPGETGHATQLGGRDLRPALQPRTTLQDERCRCGTRLPSGSRAYVVVPVAPLLASLLEEQTFCGPGCARAFVLEALALLDAPAVGAVMRDADAVAKALRALLVRLERERSATVVDR